MRQDKLMVLALSEAQERDIDEIVDLLFSARERIIKAPRWRRWLAAGEASRSLWYTKWVERCTKPGSCEDSSIGIYGLGELYAVLTRHFDALNKDNPDPERVTELGRETVVGGMRGCVEHHEYAIDLALVLMAELARRPVIPSLRYMVEAGTALRELAMGDPQLGMVGPGIEAYHKEMRADEVDQETPGRVLETLYDMVELAGQD